MLIAYSAIFAQKVIIKDDSSRQPVSGVIVSSVNGKTTDISDKYGKVDLSRFHKQDTIVFRHVSYNDLSLYIADITDKQEILLAPATIAKNGITITSLHTDKNSSSFKEEITLRQSDKLNYVSAGDLLKNQSSLFIKDYGGVGGSKTVSSRGMSSENTVVLFNEARVNDLRTGVFNFNDVDVNSIDKIIYLKSFDYETPFTSSGGVIKMYSGSYDTAAKANFRMKLNTDMLKSFAADYASGSDGISYKISAEREWSSNRYNYSFEGEKHDRENAWLSKTFFSGNIVRYTNNYKINFYSNYSYLNSGIPGFVATNNLASSRAANKTISSLSTLNTEYYFSNSLSLASNINFNYQSLTIDDPDGAIFYSNDKKKSVLKDFSLPLKLKYNDMLWSLNAGYEFATAKLGDITTMISASGIVDDISRTTHRFFAGAKRNFYDPLPFLSNIQLTALLANESLTERLPEKSVTNSFSYKAGLTLFPSFWHGFILKANYGDDYRPPTFNERYYSMLYSHYNLKSEKYKWYDAGFDMFFDLFGQTQFSASWFNIKGNNKIIWIPTRVAIQIPRNVASFQSQGVELQLSKTLLDSMFEFFGTYNYTDARNKTRTSVEDYSYNKFILYTPLHRLNLNLIFNYSNFNFSVSASYTGKRFYSTDNQYVLDPYFITDISAGVYFTVAGRRNTISITAYNITNQEYFVIQSYPMPLRTFLLTYNLEIL